MADEDEITLEDDVEGLDIDDVVGDDDSDDVDDEDDEDGIAA